MAFNGLRLEYALEGRSNYIAWKDRMEAVLEDNGLKEFIDKDVPKLDVADEANLDAWKKKVAKVRRILLEGVQDHIVSSFHGKVTPYAMWNTLTDLFQNSSDHRKLMLKDKLRKIKMEKGDSIPKYPMKFVKCRDEMGSVGIIVVDDDLVSVTDPLWKPRFFHLFVFSSRDIIPKFLWGLAQTIPSLILLHVIIGYDHRPYQKGASNIRVSGFLCASSPRLPVLLSAETRNEVNELLFSPFSYSMRPPQ
jgi:hypothetical protein